MDEKGSQPTVDKLQVHFAEYWGSNADIQPKTKARHLISQLFVVKRVSLTVCYFLLCLSRSGNQTILRILKRRFPSLLILQVGNVVAQMLSYLLL